MYISAQISVHCLCHSYPVTVPITNQRRELQCWPHSKIARVVGAAEVLFVLQSCAMSTVVTNDFPSIWVMLVFKGYMYNVTWTVSPWKPSTHYCLGCSLWLHNYSWFLDLFTPMQTHLSGEHTATLHKNWRSYTEIQSLSKQVPSLLLVGEVM